MNCEICEKPVVVGKRAEIEGSTVVVCDECSSYGKVVGRIDVKEEVVKRTRPREPEPEKFEIEDGLVLADNYQALIKNAREKLKLRQEELARSINEPASLVHRIESGKIEPSPLVGRKISQKLGIQLYKMAEDDNTKVQETTDKGLTLGDVVIVRKDKK